MSAHSYWRIFLKQTVSFVQIAECQMRSTIGGANVCTGGTAISSRISSSTFAAAKAFDGNSSTAWESWSDTTPITSWLGYHFASPVEIVQFEIGTGNVVTSVQLQYSDDGSSWTNASPEFSYGETSQRQAFQADGTKQYWRLNISERASVSGSESVVEIAELELRTLVGGSNAVITGFGGALSSSYTLLTFVPVNAFDNDPSSRFQANVASLPIWIWHNFGADREIVEYAIRMSPSGFYPPKAWTLEYSGDGTNWTVADTRSGEDGWTAGELRAFQIAGSSGPVTRRRPLYIAC